ncbi:MAG: thiamine pyrophosphate-dependent enzyme [Pyrodictiaceae archaeon]
MLVLGHELDDITTYAYNLRINGDVVIVSEDPIVENRPIYYSEWYRVNPLETVRGLLEGLRRRGVHRRIEEWDKLVAGFLEEWRSLLKEHESRSYRGRANPAKFFTRLDKVLPRERIVAAGQGTHILYAYNYLRVFKPRGFLAATNLGAMGYALPAAMAAKLAHPDHEVVAVVGDGELMMVVQDLETIAREGIAVKIIVVNDYSYRVLLLRQKIQKQGRIIGTRYTNPDFVKLAESFGIRAFRVDNDNYPDTLIKEVVETDEPVLVDLVISEEDLPPMNLDYTLRMSS